jgi:DNA-binding CsgD family transcriptional regulator/sugar-specific transcriptional regulator TrmB
MSTTRNADPLEALGLDRTQARLYTAVLRLHRATLAEIATAVDEPADDVVHQLATLIRMGAVDEQCGEYLARHPAAAVGRMVADKLDRLARESRQIDEVLATVDGLAHHYDAGRDYQTGQFSIQLVNGADELYRNVVGLAMQSPPADMVSAVPDRRTMSDFVEKYSDQWIRAVEQGFLTSRSIVPTLALTMPGVREVLGRLTDVGAKIRTLDKVPSWFFALGTDGAGLPAQWGGSLPEQAYKCYLVRAPIVVAALRSLFDQLWAKAVPISYSRGTIQVLRLAAQGLSDESIARHLGLSVRTVRARFAEAMTELGAQSRFHAGVEAARRAWL